MLFRSFRKELKHIGVVGALILAALSPLSVAVPAQAATTSSITNSPLTTTGGGGLLDINCPTGSVLSRVVSGYEPNYNGNQGVTLTAVKAVCYVLNSDGLSTAATGTVSTTYGGSSTANLDTQSVDCGASSRANTFVGARVYKTPAGYAAGVHPYCGTLASGNTRSYSNTIGIGSETGTYEDIFCAANTVAVGLHLYVGGINDKFGFNCAPVTGATQTITFTNPGAKTYSASSFALSASTTSSSSVTYSSATTSVCTVSGSNLTMVTGGSCTVNANAVADTNYAAATQVAQTFTISSAPQAALTITTLSGTAGSSLTLNTSGGSGSGAVTYAVTNGTATGCSVSGNALTATSNGTCIVTATKAADSNFLSVSSAATTVTFNASGSTCGTGLANTAFTDVLVTGGNASPCVLRFYTNNTWTVPTGVNSVNVAIVGAGGGGGFGNNAGGGAGGEVMVNPSYGVTPGTATTIGIGVGGAGGYSSNSGLWAGGGRGGSSQFGSIFAGGGGGGWGNTVPGSPAAATVGSAYGGSTGGGSSAHATADAAVTQSISGWTSSGFAGGSGNTVSGSYAGGGGGGAGAVGSNAIGGSAGAGGNGIALSAPFSMTVAGGGGGWSGAQTTGALGGTGGGGQAVGTVYGSATLPASGSAGTANTGGGGGAGWAGGSGIVFLSYNLPRSITLTNPGNKTFSATTFSLSATASIGTGAITYGSSTPLVCTVSGSTVTLVNAGTCTLTATVAADSVYQSATTSQSITVTAAGQLTPVFGTPTFSSSSWTIPVTNYDSNFTWTYSVSGGTYSVGTPSGSSVNITVTPPANTSVTLTANTSRAGYTAGTATSTSYYPGCAVTTNAQSNYTSVSFLTVGTCQYSAPSAGSYDYLVVAGGGAGGTRAGGGGGAGGYLTSVGTPSSRLALTANQIVTITVGAGGTATSVVGGSGQNSSLVASTTVTATGGGGGGTGNGTCSPNTYSGVTGGSGGGADGDTGNCSTTVAGSATSSPVQGNSGGIGSQGAAEANWTGGGGGGAGSAGGAGNSNGTPGNGGSGKSNLITGSSVCYAAGGGGGNASSATPNPGTGGSCGGVAIGGAGSKSTATATAGTANTGSGGGGSGFIGSSNGIAGAGGSGIIVLRYVTAGLTPVFDTPVATTSGFTVNITNYDPNFAFSYSSSASGSTVTPGTVSGTTLPLTISGVTAGSATTLTVTTTASGYSGISGSATVSATANQLSQTLTISSTAPTTAVVGGTTYTVTGSASSGLTVTYSIDPSASAVCSIAGAVVSFLTAGTCKVNANQAGNSQYLAASQVQQSFTVGKGTQATIAVTSTSGSYGGTVNLTYSGSSGTGAVSFAIVAGGTATGCSITGTTLSYTSAGTCLVTVTRATDANYNAATSATATVTIAKVAQTITFGLVADRTITSGSFTVSPTTDATGQTVVLTASPSSVCTVSGFTVTMVAAGTCSLSADVATSTNYLVATTVTRSFAISNVVVTFNSNWGTATTATQTITNPTATALNANTFTRAGYVFTGWATNADGSGTTYTNSQSALVPATVTLYAQWRATSYTINYNLNYTGSTGTTDTYLNNGKVTLPTPTRPGYTFTGWADAASGTVVGSGGAQYSPLTSGSLFARYETEDSTSYLGTGSTVYDQAAGINSSVTGQTNLTLTGAPTFSNVSPAPITFNGSGQYAVTGNLRSRVIDGKISLFVWVYPTSSTGTIVEERGTDPITSWYDSQIDMVSGKVRFGIWGYTQGAGLVTSTNSLTLNTWHYLGFTYDGSTFTAYIDGAQTGSQVTNFTRSVPWPTYGLYYGLGTAAPTNMGTGGVAGAFKFGSFQAWNAGLSTTSVAQNYQATCARYGVTGCTGSTLYAQWTANTNTVTYDSQLGSAVANGSFTTGGSLTLPAAPNRTGYTFNGWFTSATGGTALTSPYSPSATGAITLYAQWTATPYTVTYNTQGGSTVAAGSYTIGGTVTLPTAPTKSNYSFTGWFLAASGGSALGTTYSPPSTGAITLYAQWTAQAVAPTIGTQPVAISRSVGQSASFTVAASVTDGGALSYQWYKGATPISGATAATYSFTTTALSDAANYSVVITNNLNGATNTVTSSAVALTMSSAVSLSAPSTGLTGTYGSGYSLTLPAATGGTGTYTYAVTSGSLPSGATLSGNVISATSLLAAGTYAITVTATDGNLATAAASFTITVNKANQTITFGALPNTTLGTAAPTPNASASSGVGVTYSTSSASTICTVTSAGVVTLVGAGACVITAAQAGNSNWNAAPSQSQTFTIAASFGITAPTTGLTATYNTAYSLSVAAAGGASPISYAVTGTLPTGLTINASSGLISGTPTVPGTYPVTVTATDANSNSATTASFTITVNKAAQTITFNPPATRTITSGSFAISASTSASGQAVTLAVVAATPAVCSLANGTVTILGVGTCTITADVAASTNYLAATQVSRGIVISPVAVTFNSNYGTPTTASQSITSPSGANLTANGFNRTGYSFAGWSTTSGTAAVAYANLQAVTFAADTTLYAQWSANTYTVTYDANGGTGSAARTSDTYTTAASAISLPGAGSLAKSGYVFGGWSAMSGGSALSGSSATAFTTSTDITLYAVWGAGTYTVTYDANGGTGAAARATDSYTTGASAIALPGAGTLAKSGYTFGGWAATTTGAALTGTNVTAYTTAAGVTLYAVWTPVNYGVTYTAPTATAGAVPTDATSYHITQSLTVKGNTGSLTRTGYTFAGWTVAADGSGTVLQSGSQVVLGAANVNLYAKWTANTYTVSYNVNGATGTPSRTSDSYTTGGTAITLPLVGTMAKTGYDFAGWSTTAGGSALAGTYTTASNDTLYAVWTIKTIAVTYSKGDRVNASFSLFPSNTSATYGSFLVTSSSVQSSVTENAQTYDFVGWSDGNNTYRKGDLVLISDQPVALTAIWVPVYAVRYTFGGGTPATGDTIYDSECSPSSPYTCTDQQAITSNSAPTRTGYTFAGWVDQTGASVLTAGLFTVSATRYLIYATWTPINYTVTYLPDGGSTVPTQAALNIGQTFTVGSAITKAGYGFGGWSDGNQTYGAGATYTVGSSNVSLTPVWVPDVYAVTYDWNGGYGTPEANKQYTVGTGAYSLPAVTDHVKDGYTFNGWSESPTGAMLGTTYTPTATKTLYAIWGAGSYALNLDTRGGSTTTNSYTVANGSAQRVPTPTRTHFHFDGWYSAPTGGTLLSAGDSDYTPAASQTLYAGWTQDSLFGIGPTTKLVSQTATGGVGTTFVARTSSTDSVSVDYLPDTLPSGTVMDVYRVNDTAGAAAVLGAGKNYLLNVVVSWLAADGTVPTTAAGKPLTVTIQNPAIKAGAVVYMLIGGTSQMVGTATQDGVITAQITDDPQLVVAAVVPGAPTAVGAVAGNASATVSWTAPVSNGGSAITGYLVTSSGGQTCTTTGTSCVVSGLTNGTAYTFTVVANNLVGASPASTATASVTPLASQTIGFGALAGKTVGMADFTLSATASSGLTVAFATASTGICSITGTSVHVIAAGACVITASQAGNASTAAATPVQQQFTVSPALVVTTPTTGLTGAYNSSYSLQVVATGGAANLGYAITTGALPAGLLLDPATGIISGIPSISGDGHIVVTVTDANGATAATANFNIVINTIAQAALTVTSTSGTFGNNLTLAVTGGTTAGSVSYTVAAGTTTCTLAGALLTAAGAGTCSVTATMAGNAYYSPVSSAATTVTFAKANQAALIIGSTSGTYGTPLTLTTSGGSGAGALSYALTTASAVCQLNGTTLTASGAGSCDVTATLAGNANYNVVSSNSTTVTFAQAGQAAVLVTTTSGTYGTPITLGATGGSGTAGITFSVANGTTTCTLTAGSLSVAGAGTCIVTATRAADANYTAQSSAPTTVTFAHAAQSITFGQLSNKTLGAGTVALTATASSGLGVTFTSTNTSVCTVSGSTVTLVSAGTCTIAADQAGDGGFAAAGTASRSFTVAPALTLATPTTGLSGTYNSQYSLALVDAGGAGTNSFTITAGALPAGLTLDAGTGLISGTPSVVGGSAVTVTVTDANGATANTGSFTIAVGKAAQAALTLGVTTGTVGTPITLATSGGSGTGAVSYVAANGTGTCTLTAGVLSATAAGTCTVTATKAADANYNSATTGPVTVTFAAAPVMGGGAPIVIPPLVPPVVTPPAPSAWGVPVIVSAPSNGTGTGTGSGGSTGTGTGTGTTIEPAIPLLVSNGVATPVSTVVTSDQQGLKFSTPEWQITIKAAPVVAPSGGTATTPATPAVDGSKLVVTQGATVTVSGDAFQANSVVQVWVYSTPRLIGTVQVKADGSFATSLPLPADLILGEHTLVLQGLNASLKVQTAQAPMLVKAVQTIPVAGKITASIRFASTGAHVTPRIQRAVGAYAKALGKPKTIHLSAMGYYRSPNSKPRAAALCAARAQRVAKLLKRSGVAAAIGCTTAVSRSVKLPSQLFSLSN